MFNKILSRLSVCLVVTTVVLGLLACSKEVKFNNVDISGSTAFAKNFELTDHLGHVRHLNDFKGKVVVMFFGYTQCPDVCPTTMVEMQGVMKLLGDDAKRVQVIFVTVDPERDTQEVLAQYVPAFDPTFIGLRPQSPEALKEVTTGFKVFYQKVPGKTEGSYTIDHTAGSYVFDPEGRLRLFIKHGQGGQPLADDIKALLK
jgi:protein SCO1/2